MPRTSFTETEALLLAMEDADVDSGVYTVDAYLDEQFMETELRALANAADLLSERAWEAYQRKRAVPSVQPGERA